MRYLYVVQKQGGVSKVEMAMFTGLTRCEFSEVQTLLTFALVEAQRGGRVWWPQKNAWHARVARRMTCA